jgi:hypothetical protein
VVVVAAVAAAAAGEEAAGVAGAEEEAAAAAVFRGHPEVAEEAVVVVIRGRQVAVVAAVVIHDHPVEAAVVVEADIPDHRGEAVEVEADIPDLAEEEEEEEAYRVHPNCQAVAQVAAASLRAQAIGPAAEPAIVPVAATQQVCRRWVEIVLHNYPRAATVPAVVRALDKRGDPAVLVEPAADKRGDRAPVAPDAPPNFPPAVRAPAIVPVQAIVRAERVNAQAPVTSEIFSVLPAVPPRVAQSVALSLAGSAAGVVPGSSRPIAPESAADLGSPIGQAPATVYKGRVRSNDPIGMNVHRIETISGSNASTLGAMPGTSARPTASRHATTSTKTRTSDGTISIAPARIGRVGATKTEKTGRTTGRICGIIAAIAPRTSGTTRRISTTTFLTIAGGAVPVGVWDGPAAIPQIRGGGGLPPRSAPPPPSSTASRLIPSISTTG